MIKVVAMDKTSLMIDIMKMELQKFNGIKEKFIVEFSKEDFDYIDQVCHIKFLNVLLPMITFLHLLILPI